MTQRKSFAVFDGHGGKDAAEFAKIFLCNKITKQKGFYSENTTLVMNNIKDGFLATHLDMSEQLGELVSTKCSSASKLLGEWYIFTFSLKHVIGLKRKFVVTKYLKQEGLITNSLQAVLLEQQNVKENKTS